MKNLRTLTRFSWLLVIAIIFYGCKDDEDVIVGEPPVADAGTDINAFVGSTVTLNGSNSSDPEGEALSFSWELTQTPAGSSATISNASSEQATFIPDEPGEYTAALTVEDEDGNTDTDDVVISATVNENEAPEAVITDSNNQSIAPENDNNVINVGNTFQLSGANSTDPEDDDLTYLWEVTSAPTNSTPTLSNEETVTLDFTADLAGEYVIALTVNDGNGNESTAEVTIEAEVSPVEISSNVDENTTWENIYDDPSLPDYIITKSIDINAELTVEAGVYVQVVEDAFIEVESTGLLNAVGTDNDSIKFTSSNIAAGLHWGGINFKSGYLQNELTYTEISYAGNSDIDYLNSGWRTANIAVANNGKLTLKNSTVTNSKEEGMYVSGELEVFENNVFKDNNSYPVSIPFNEAGKIDGNSDVSGNGSKSSVRIYGSTMTDDQSIVALANQQSYRVTGEIDLESVLNIGEGVQFAFDEDVFFRVNEEGNIIAEGNASNKIVMTSSNISGGLYWGGLDINSGYSSNKLDHVEVSYAGNSEMFYENSGWRSANVGIQDNGLLTITNSNISNGEGDGIYCGTESLNVFENNEFVDNNGYAIVIEFNDIGAIDGNSTFSGNGDDGVTIYGSTTSNNQSIADLAGDAYYLFTGSSTIGSDVTIEEGSEFRFNEDVSLTVNSSGTVVASGASGNMITFTSANQAGGIKWAGILIESNSEVNEFNYVEVSHGGGTEIDYINSGWRTANIAIASGKLKLNDCVISHSGENGIVVGSSGFLNGLNSGSTDPASQIEANNSFSDNGSDNLLFL
ncbi:PKD domain-containing protein [Marivirga sp. S37H4]|uniref:PKD domain-containing protein n=1 Tax=Marivirga aurantiaca TaxID=2802615 RepID=A0A934X007_9BACT|nr:right-handed parallel beta-helix repeat-containing protein [Marivirga aurantiaca]MBK6265972.1 PKD domain-containing protein [Marivirga aurantiaca]